MSTMGERLRQARKDAGFQSARAAAMRHGWTVSTYLAHENGQNEFFVETAQIYADAFRVSPSWLLTGRGEPSNARILKIYGLVSAGVVTMTSAENHDHNDGLGEIESPFDLPEDAIALQVSGDSMWPRYDDGDVIVCLKRHRPIEEMMGFEACVLTADGNRLLKRLRPGARKGTFDLESFNAPPIKGAKITEALSVHTVIRAGQWRKLDNAARQRLLKSRARKRDT